MDQMHHCVVHWLSAGCLLVMLLHQGHTNFTKNFLALDSVRPSTSVSAFTNLDALLTHDYCNSGCGISINGCNIMFFVVKVIH